MTRRGRRLQLPENFGEYNFAKMAKKESHAPTRIRLLGLAHIQEGKSLRETAHILKVHENTPRVWLNRFKSGGVEGLKEKPGRGAKPKLPVDQMNAFREAVIELQSNKNGGRIRGKDVLELMKNKLGIDCCLDTAYETLHKANFVWITGRSQHPKAVPEEQIEFKKNLEKK